MDAEGAERYCRERLNKTAQELYGIEKTSQDMIGDETISNRSGSAL